MAQIAVQFVSQSSTQHQRDAAILVFGTADFLPVFEKLSKQKGKGIDVSKIIQLLQFLEEASDEDLFSYKDSPQIEEVKAQIKLLSGSATLLDFQNTLLSFYVPLRRIGGGSNLTIDIKQEMAATKQPLKNIRPAGVSAAKPRTGRFKHPDQPFDSGTKEIPAYRR